MRRYPGFSLIEMLVVVLIVAILAAIAYPAYREYIHRARRADALDAMLHIQNLQEKWRASHPAYGSLELIGYPGGDSPAGHYRLVTSRAGATGYSITATAVGVQTGDSECATMTLVVDAANPRGLKSPAKCWHR
ncbi:MAG: type IV pilin protein [Porticoccaceae bacterium]